jgi:hypothetical protein
MTTQNLTAIHPAGADFVSESWEVLAGFPHTKLAHGSVQVVWEGIDAGTGTLEIQVSNDNIHWNCYSDQTTIPAGSESQIYEFNKFTTRYLRVKWTKNTVSAGTITIWTAGYAR